MTKQRLLLWGVITVVLAGVVMPAHAAPAPKEPAPKVVGQKAGAVSALLPIATITRGVGKAAVTSEAKKGSELVWNDLLKTERGGRARITLVDQSILSLGSQSQLKIVKHDTRSQQTALQLYGGRMRAEVAKITRQGGSFELRTPTAVAGVIGTDFGSDASSVGTTVFLCISGVVQVSNSDPNVLGSVQCAPGLTTSVSAGKPPTIPTNATPQQIQQLIQDTEPAIISAMAPATAMPGTTVDAAISGTKLGSVNKVSVKGTGVTATISGTPTDAAVTVHLVIAANATPGPVTITLSKPSGAESAAVFTIMQPPTAAQGGDLKKPWHDQFDQERQSNKANLTAQLATVQQTVDQTLQALQEANQGSRIDLGTATTNLNGQVANIQNAINQASGQVDQAVTSALAAFDTQYQIAWNALLQRNPAGVPDDAFNQALQAAYSQVHTSLGQAFAGINGSLNTNVQTATGTVTQLQQTWMTTIAAAAIVPPTPAVNNSEFSINLGAAFGGGTVASPDAGRSKGNNGATVVRYQWALCDSSYKPAQFGVPIAATATGCSPLAGYASTNSDFPFPTCNLAPADYIARVIVTDSNNQQAAMDVKIHVLAPPTHADPKDVVLDLATAYGNLQSTPVLALFDETTYAGYQSLKANLEATFPQLSYMSVNPQISQNSVSCNDATVRTTWNEKYAFKDDPSATQKTQNEQLSMRMIRVPGTGWKIYDFQGDNGTVQGQLPGPAVTTNPQPDMEASAVFATYVGQQTTAAQTVPPGAQSFTAVISNVGGADLTAAAAVRFALMDVNGTVLTTADAPLVVPLASGASQNVTATLTVPSSLVIGAPFQVGVNVNPGCLVPEANCNAANNNAQSLILGTPVHLVETVTPALLAGGPAGVLTVTVDAPGTFGLVLPAGIIGCAPAPCVPSAANASPITQTVTAADGGTLSWGLQAGFTAATGSALTANITFQGFSFPVAYSVAGQANYAIQSVSFVGHTAPYTGANGLQIGETFLISVAVANVGNISPTGSITVTASCSGGPPNNTSCQGNNNPNTTIAAPAAGTVTNATITATLDAINWVPGTYTGTAALTTTIPQSSTADDSASVAFEAVNFSLTIAVPPNFAGSQPGAGMQVRPLAVAPTPPTQNVLLGGTAQVSVTLDETGNPTPFSLTITAGTDNGSVPMSPPSSTGLPRTANFSTGGSPASAVPVTAVFNATNHGVTNSATQVLNYVACSITPTNLFLNDASNPLEVQMGQTSSSANPTITLKLNCNPIFSGNATVTAPAPTGGFTTTVDGVGSSSVAAGGTFNVQVSAIFGATSTITPLAITATLPNSNPPANVTFTLFVKAIGVPDLQVVSVTPARTLSSTTPLLSGEGLDFTIVLKNNGNTASAGNEVLTMNLNGFQVDPAGYGRTSVKVPSLQPGASTSIVVHVIAPDIGTGVFSGGTLVTKVAADNTGDLDYTNNSLTQSIAVANWRVAVSGAGSQDAPGASSGPLVVTIDTTPSPWSSQALVVGTVDGGGSTSLTFIPTAGVVGTRLSIANFAAGTPANSFLATVSTSDNTTQTGLYPAQVIVELMDNGSVTAQRQATIHVSIQNTLSVAPNYPLTVTCTHNGASCVAGASPATTIQVNGALTEPYVATVTPSSCTPTAGVTCQGTADIVVTDAVNTTTTPPQAKGQPFNSGAVFNVSANQDPNGNIVAGAAGGYSITINGIQRGGQTSPDPVGQSVSVPVNVGDISITATTGANSCTGVVANGPPTALNVSWNVLGGFNAPAISWEWEDGNHVPVGASSISFTSPSGTSSFGGGTYTSLPSFNLTNTRPQDGLLQYFFAITISNSTSTATKYFPFYFDTSLSQGFCGAAGVARGFVRVSGSWSRSASGGGGPLTLGSRLGVGAASGAVDLHLSAADVSYTPSLPKAGDTVQVRFKVRNDGTSDAKGVPIALQVNGVTVASDTFDVGAGRATLGGLQWNSAGATAAIGTRPAALRPARRERRGGKGTVAETGDAIERPAAPTRLSAMLVIDPQHTIQQKTTLDKSAPLAHFSLRSADAAAGGVAGPAQRVLLEIQEGACAGMRLTTGGVGPCGTAELELTVADVGKGTYTMNAAGIADLGAAFAGAALGNAQFSGELAALAGHSYAVQLNGGRSAMVNVDLIRNPSQLDAATRAVFRNSAIRVMRSLGSDSGAAAPGDLAGGMRGPSVFVQLTVQVQ